MKLFNKDLAGMKLKISSGVLEIGADGSVEVNDEKIEDALRRSGFRPDDEADKSKDKPKPRPVDKKESEKVEKPEEVEAEVEKVIQDEDEELEEVEIADLNDYSAKDAVELVSSVDDVDILEAWLENEGDGKNRKTVLNRIQSRIAEVI